MGKHHLKIGVDLTGGDHPPETVLQQLLGLQNGIDPSLNLVFFATPLLTEKFKEICKNYPDQKNLSFVETKDLITMEDCPLASLRLKKNSPPLVALNHIKAGQLDALVSLSNTGALVAGSNWILKTLKGIRRPALLAMLPTLKTPVAVIDVGAHLHTSCQHLLQYAKMGIAYIQTLGIKKPRVGLLNIGREKEKGKLEMRDAYKKLSQLCAHDSDKTTFIGNIEPKNVFLGEVDVLVTEGFSGNIFLKTAEGVTGFILEKLSQKPTHGHESLIHLLTHLLNSAQYPGALVCGVDGVVIKCHGDSTGMAIHSGIKGAAQLLRTDFLKNLKAALRPT